MGAYVHEEENSTHLMKPCGGSENGGSSSKVRILRIPRVFLVVMRPTRRLLHSCPIRWRRKVQEAQVVQTVKLNAMKDCGTWVDGPNEVR